MGNRYINSLYALEKKIILQNKKPASFIMKHIPGV